MHFYTDPKDTTETRHFDTPPITYSTLFAKIFKMELMDTTATMELMDTVATIATIENLPKPKAQEFSIQKHNKLMLLGEMGDSQNLIDLPDKELIPQLFLKICQFGTPNDVLYMLTCTIYSKFIFNYDTLTKAIAVVNEKLNRYSVDSPYAFPLHQINGILYQHLNVILYNNNIAIAN